MCMLAAMRAPVPEKNVCVISVPGFFPESEFQRVHDGHNMCMWKNEMYAVLGRELSSTHGILLGKRVTSKEGV